MHQAEKHKKTLGEEILSLRERVAELEKDYMVKSNEASSAVTAKEEALSSASAAIERLKHDNSLKMYNSLSDLVPLCLFNSFVLTFNQLQLHLPFQINFLLSVTGLRLWKWKCRRLH